MDLSVNEGVHINVIIATSPASEVPLDHLKGKKGENKYYDGNDKEEDEKDRD